MSRLFLAGLILIGVLLGWQVVRSSSWQLNAVSQPQNTPQPRSTGFSVSVPIAASASAPAAVPQSRPNTTTPMPPSQIRPTTKPAFPRPPIPAAW
ncbi:hypothetical protein [Pantanalinema sp. GBBB05]|uniref:hypothetical protein n=1 Tax=Pantanalinema sp. GBBB05 TaxID=2604139 RepID=UPI001DA6B8BD|nr:hypothetical protein [Pantanalinema sp. GBBB05]